MITKSLSVYHLTSRGLLTRSTTIYCLEDWVVLAKERSPRGGRQLCRHRLRGTAFPTVGCDWTGGGRCPMGWGSKHMYVYLPVSL